MTNQPVSNEELEQIQTLRNLMESVLESSLDGIVLVDEQGKVRAVNQAFIKLYGFENCDLIGMDLHQILGSATCLFADPSELAKFFAEIFALGDPAIRRSLELDKPAPRVISFYARPVIDREGSAGADFHSHRHFRRTKAAN